MNRNKDEKPSIMISKHCPLIISDEEYCKAYSTVTLLSGGFIEIMSDCTFSIDKLIKEDESVSEDPDIIVKGVDGTIGNPGEDGRDGEKGAIAQIKIIDLQSDINVHVYGGGNGGEGGRGGDGGKGGNGGFGANGGCGGDGGKGKNGGNAGSGGEFTIWYGTTNGSKIAYKTLAASGGVPGKGGKGGKGGTGIVPGNDGRDCDDGECGLDGEVGKVTIHPLLKMRYHPETAGSRVLNYSNPEDSKYVLDSLGGEELIKEKFPKVYEAFLRTKEKHALLKAGTDEKNDKGLEELIYAAPITFVKNNDLKAVVNGPDKPEGSLQSLTEVQGKEEWLHASVTGLMMNVTQDNWFKNFYFYIEGENYLQKMLECDVENVVSFNDQTLQTIIIVNAYKKEDEMHSYIATSAEYIVQGGITPVVYMSLDDPKSTVGNDPIIMMYARGADSGEVVDYDYPDNKKEPDPSHAVNTIFPVKGQITFNDKFKPVGFSKAAKSYKISLLYQNQGVCTYNHSADEITSCFHISEKNPQVVTFELNKDWNTKLDISAYTTAHDAVVGLCFSFFYEVLINGQPDLVPISIYSTKDVPKNYYEVYDDTNLKLPQIYIKWGCFAKDTRIVLADGSEKEITEIEIDDDVLGENGRKLRVTGKVKGLEEKVINIRTVQGKKLGVTETHPIKTSRGILRAKDVRAGDFIACVSGEEDEVEFAYYLEYNEEVYGISTAGGSQMIGANGIWAGNLDMQNDSAVLTKEETVLDDNVIETANQFKELLKYLEEKGTNKMGGYQ